MERKLVLTINYPGGKPFIQTTKSNEKKFSMTHSNRGMSLENEINLSNQFYLNNHIAVIHKKPTPIQIVNVDYPKRAAAKITEAYFKQPSTTDYNGVFKGKYIDFDAKETKNKTSFPLHNIHEHQINHLKECINAGGVGFFIIRFTSNKNKETYVVPAKYIFKYWDNQLNGSKSIKKDFLMNNGYLIPQKLNPVLPYLSAVDQMLTDNNY